MRLPRRSPAGRDHDGGAWMKKQKHILVTLAFFAGGAMFASRSSTITNRDSWSKLVPHLRVRRRGSHQKSSPQSLRVGHNRSIFSTPSSSLLSAFDVVQIPINPYSTLHEDVKSIEHLPAFSRIDIRLKDGANCPRPYVMGRLSGPTLVMLQDWKWSPIHTTNTTILTGHYQVPESGQYNLEIIALHCHDFLHNMKQKGHLGWAHNGTETWDSDIDKTVCLEDPWRHRLTDEIAPVAVDHTVGAFVQHNKGDKGGHWRNQGWKKHEGPPDQKPSPIFTQFRSAKGMLQVDEGSRGAYIHDRNQPASELARTIHKEKRRELEHTRICMIGSSQSHQQQHLFRQRTIEFLGEGNKTDSNPILSWGSVESPTHVTRDFAKILVERQRCQKLIFMGMNPWSMRRDGDRNTPSKIGDFYHAIYGMLRNLVSVASSFPGSQPMDIYVVSLPYHSLDASMTSCPPSNWKTPPLIDGYNAAIAKACNDLWLGGSANNVTFVDTRPLVSPVWDFFGESSPAGQPSKHALTAESLHVARTVLGLLDNKAELEIFR